MLALIPGERILYHSKPHWVYLAGASTFLLIGLSCSCCTGLTALAEPSPGQPPPPEGMIYSFVTCSSCILALALLGVVTSTLYHINTDFFITNKRIVVQGGGLRRRSLEIYLSKIDSVYVETSLLGNLLGYGTVVIRSGASEQRLPKFARTGEINQRILGARG